ncbi:MAG: cytochrome c3 family protein [Bryobacteraceae bacterium]|nr:cytochrome c3 family protein [Bryobacteraceae bacterium]
MAAPALTLMLLLAALASPQEPGALCATCHSEHAEDLRSHKHFAAKLSCEVCHGASEKHRKAVGAAAPDRVAAPDEVPALCGGCHAPQQKTYVASTHGKLVLARSSKRAANCGACHGVHAPRWAAAMERQCARCHESLPQSCKGAPRQVNARLACAGCHEPHSLARQQ